MTIYYRCHMPLKILPAFSFLLHSFSSPPVVIQRRLYPILLLHFHSYLSPWASFSISFAAIYISSSPSSQANPPYTLQHYLAFPLECPKSIFLAPLTHSILCIVTLLLSFSDPFYNIYFYFFSF